MSENPIIGQNPQNPNLKIDINSIKNEKCKCGSELWSNSFILKKISKIQSPSGKDELGNIPIIICVECHTPYPSYQGLVNIEQSVN